MWFLIEEEKKYPQKSSQVCPAPHKKDPKEYIPNPRTPEQPT